MSMDYSLMIAGRIEQLCRERGITLHKLATMSGVPSSTLDNLVKGNIKTPTLLVIHRISNGLGMTPIEFLNFPAFLNYSFEDEEE